MNRDRFDIEFIGPDADGDESGQDVAHVSSRSGRWLPFVLLSMVAALILWSVIKDGEPASPHDGAEQTQEEAAGAGASGSRASERLDAVRAAQSIPRSLLVAELFAAEPTGAGLRDLFEVVGRFDGLEIATAEGAFDLVRFDPLNPDRLLAARRSSYGIAENQMVNEIWEVTPAGEVDQALWAPGISHDFVHFNADGTATMWVHGGGDGFAPRVAVVVDAGSLEAGVSSSDFSPTSTSRPIYASRFTSAAGTLFALTGTGDYYTDETRYVDLVADDGTGPVVLDDGARYAWIDNPTPEVLVAYPHDGEGLTSVWDVATLEPLPNHMLAGRPYERAAISGNRRVAIGATSEGDLEVVDLSTGVTRGTFGSVRVTGVDQPIALNDDGTIAVTVENTGRVDIWWVGDQLPVASIVADEGQPRWVSSIYAATTTSIVSPDASRIALRVPAIGRTPSRWIITDIDIDSWIRRACERAGRALTRMEVEALGLPDGPRACTG